jgi:hypothetical protein
MVIRRLKREQNRGFLQQYYLNLQMRRSRIFLSNFDSEEDEPTVVEINEDIDV